MKVKARGSREASKVFGLCLHHYGFLKDITGSPCIVEVWMSDVHHADSKSSYKLWKMDEKIYCECTVAANKVTFELEILVFLFRICKVHNLLLIQC